MLGQDTPNLRKRPSRGTTSKYSVLSKSPSVNSPPNINNASNNLTSPVTTRSSSMDSNTMTSSFMLSSTPAPVPMPLLSSSSSSFAAKKRALKLPEKNFSEKIHTLIPESKLYTALQDFEKSLDISLARRQLDVQEAMRVRNTLKQTKLIRLTVFNTYAHQTGTYQLDSKSQANMAEPASWTLRIEGRIDDPAYRNPKVPRKKFSSFIKKAFFQLGDDANNTIEWDRATAQVSETDGWEIKRVGDQEIEVKITLFLELSPSKVKLEPLLAALLGIHTETRPRIIMSLWQYIKANRLLDPNDRKTINCDENLKIVFGCDTMQFSDIPKHLRTHLSPPDPVEISHVIKLSGDPYDHAAAYEIAVEQDDTVAIQPSAIYKREIANIEEQISQVIQQVNEHKRKRDFMLDFYNEPVQFLNKLVDNQVKNDKLIQAYPGRDPEEERKTSFFYQPYVEEAVQSYVAKHNYAHQPHVKVNLNLPQNQTPTTSNTTTSTPYSSSSLPSTPFSSSSSLPTPSMPATPTLPTSSISLPHSLPIPQFPSHPSSPAPTPHMMGSYPLTPQHMNNNNINNNPNLPGTPQQPFTHVM